jgi:hypothetical protein
MLYEEMKRIIKDWRERKRGRGLGREGRRKGR